MPFMKSLPEDASQLHLFKKYPRATKPLMALVDILMRGPSPFTDAERELIAAYTSGLNACHYCHGTHKVTAEVLGIEEGLVTRLLDDIDSAGVEDRFKPIFRYVKKLTEKPSDLVQADADAIFEAGWDDDAFHHTVSVCALFNYFNRILEGHGIKLDAAYHYEAGKRLANAGYLPILKALNID